MRAAGRSGRRRGVALHPQKKERQFLLRYLLWRLRELLQADAVNSTYTIRGYIGKPPCAIRAVFHIITESISRFHRRNQTAQTDLCRAEIVDLVDFELRVELAFFL